MRKSTLALSVAAALASTSAVAQPMNHPEAATYATGAAVAGGTIVGLGAAEGWWGAGPASLGTAAGAAALGLVVGIAIPVGIHSVTTPCHGYLIGLDMWNPGPSQCVNGRLGAPPAPRAARRR